MLNYIKLYFINKKFDRRVKKIEKEVNQLYQVVVNSIILNDRDDTTDKKTIRELQELGGILSLLTFRTDSKSYHYNILQECCNKLFELEELLKVDLEELIR